MGRLLLVRALFIFRNSHFTDETPAVVGKHGKLKMPTTSRYLSFEGLIPVYPNEIRRTLIRLQPNVIIPRGTILSEFSSGIFEPYAPGMLAQCILEFDCKTDSLGRAWYYLAYGVDYKPVYRVTAFTAGTFRCCELHGLDAAAIATLGKLIGAEGSIFQEPCEDTNDLLADNGPMLLSDDGSNVIVSSLDNDLLNGCYLQMS
jgi:hypothetical protein